jgi:hypothetical protein
MLHPTHELEPPANPARFRGTKVHFASDILAYLLPEVIDRVCN